MSEMPFIHLAENREQRWKLIFLSRNLSSDHRISTNANELYLQISSADFNDLPLFVWWPWAGNRTQTSALRSMEKMGLWKTRVQNQIKVSLRGKFWFFKAERFWDSNNLFFNVGGFFLGTLYDKFLIN